MRLIDKQVLLMPSDYYKILNIPVDATDLQIKTAYREKAKIWHPDINNTPVANSRFLLVGEAYKTLINSTKRKRYDLKLKYGTDIQGIYSKAQKFHRDKRYTPKPGTFYHYQTWSRQKVKQEKSVVMLENFLFWVMIIIGGLGLLYSIFDLISNNQEIFMNGIQGLLFSTSFLYLLIYGWLLYRRRRG